MENFGVIETYEEEEEEESDEEEEEQKSASKTEEGVKVPKPNKFDLSTVDEKGLKILIKLARFLLQRYMHPREFFGPAIYKQTVTSKQGEKKKDVMEAKDFYLRMKLASIRKTIKENESLNQFLYLSKEHTKLFKVQKVIKALETVAQEEQAKIQEEM